MISFFQTKQISPIFIICSYFLIYALNSAQTSWLLFVAFHTRVATRKVAECPWIGNLVKVRTPNG